MIFYLSCTGNTKWAATQIAHATGERMLYLPDVRDVHSYTLYDGERLGFCFPVHGWRPPVMLRDFISKLNITNARGHYTYAVCTAGDDIGETMDILQGDLAAVGLHADSVYSLIMPESYVGLPLMDVDKPLAEKRKKEKAAADLQEYMRDIVDRRCGISRLVRGRWPKINSRVIGSVFVRHLVTDQHFRVDSEKCTRCGRCASLCPAHDIDGGRGKQPRWLHNGRCLNCFACYHHCPTRAIAFGWMTKGKGQYYYERCTDRNNK